MKRWIAVITTLFLLTLLVACQQTPSDTIVGLEQTSSDNAEASIEYTVFESLEDFITEVESAEEELQSKGVRSNTLSPEAKSIKTNGLTKQKIYVPNNLIATYGLEGVKMNLNVYSLIFPPTQEARGISFTCMLSLDPAVYPIEGWFPQGKPIDFWSFQSGETTYFVEVGTLLVDPTTKFLAVYFAYDGFTFRSNLPYGTSNEDIATLLTLEPASTTTTLETTQTN